MGGCLRKLFPTQKFPKMVTDDAINVRKPFVSEGLSDRIVKGEVGTSFRNRTEGGV